MGVSLLEVLEYAGYHPTVDKADAKWLLSVQSEFEGLVEIAEDITEVEERGRDEPNCNDVKNA